MKELLNKYRTGNISPDEFDILASEIERTPDKRLAEILREEWFLFEKGGAEKKESAARRFFRNFRRAGFWTGTAACILLAVSVMLSLKLRSSENLHRLMASREVTVRAGNDGRSSVLLPDGTNVVLNARSSITYSSDFGFSDRTVTIVGDGFFDVQKDDSRKFVVKAPDMEITVHGTKFNVYAYPDSDCSEMSLMEGNVSVECNGRTLTLSPNEKVNYFRTSGLVSVSHADNELETAWMKDRIVFIHEPLSRVIEILERRFGVNISCPDAISLADRYTGTFEDRSIADILDILRMHYGFSYSIKETQITLINN